MLEENPYQPPPLQTARHDARMRIAVVLWWLVYLHPVIVLALVYTCWGITTLSLGHPPGFGEHPENELAHRVLHMLDLPAMLLIFGTPILIPIALWLGIASPFGAVIQGESPIWRRAACLIIYVLMLAVAVSIYSYDPFRVVDWFLD